MSDRRRQLTLRLQTAPAVFTPEQKHTNWSESESHY